MIGSLRRLRDPLYLNSLFIIVASMISSAFGFLFWVAAARIYSPRDIGMTIAIMSSITLIVSIARLGLDQSIIRWIPERNKSALYITTLIVTSLSGISFGLIFVAGLEFWGPDILLIRGELVHYLGMILLLSFAFTATTCFTALRRSDHYLIQTMVMGSRFLFLPIFTGLGIMGMIVSIEASLILAAMYSVIMLGRLGIKITRPDWGFLRESFRFSLSNYLSNLLLSLPASVLPIIILNGLGAESGANYYMAYAVMSILLMVPNATATSLFVESSYGRGMRSTIWRTLRTDIVIMIPLITGVFLFGEWILGIIGSSYADNATDLLAVMSITGVAFIPTSLFIAAARVRRKAMSILKVSLTLAVLHLALSQVLMSYSGFIGLGYAWTISYSIVGVLCIWGLRGLMAGE